LNREQKAAVIDEVAGELKEAQAVFAVDYRGISVQQAAELRTQLIDAGARFRVVKNRLTARAVDKAGAEGLKDLLEGPTAFAFVAGDAALAAKALATFRREHGLLAFKGGTMEGRPLTIEEIEAISRLPGRDVLHGQFVGVLASPLTGLVRGLGSMISGLAIQLEQIREQGLVGGEAPAETPEEEQPPAETAGDEEPAEQEGEGPPSESAAEHEQQEGDVTETTPEGGGEAPEPAASEAGEAAEEAVEQEASAEEARSDAPGDPVAEGEAAEAEETEEKEG
jgi:large subunit ribosomal protein L10